MAAGKEIRTKISSIQSTQKITRAMEMVAASKMRKAQLRMLANRPYADKIRQVIEHLAQANSEYQHPFLLSRPQKRVGLIVVATDRGLCGGLNVNLFRFLLTQLEQWQQQDIAVDIAIIGAKAEAFFKRLGANVVAAITNLGENAGVKEVIGPVQVMLQAFEAHKIDGLYLAYNQFVNTMVQKPILLDLLPITEQNLKSSIKQQDDARLPQQGWDYIYEPNAKYLLDILLIRFIESQIYQSTVENFACEQAARMVAMKSATDNAGDFIETLRLAYNKARQAAITQELSEIVSGAAAV
jgi:F-type H+-transporting ATPase subunit gamma